MTPLLLVAGGILGVLMVVFMFVLSPAKNSHVAIVVSLLAACVGCLVASLVVSAGHASTCEAACRAAGGVPGAGMCLKKSAVLELP